MNYCVISWNKCKSTDVQHFTTYRNIKEVINTQPATYAESVVSPPHSWESIPEQGRLHLAGKKKLCSYFSIWINIFKKNFLQLGIFFNSNGLNSFLHEHFLPPVIRASLLPFS